MSKNLTHLQQLEAESIHIIREVVAEFANPVMLYSIGKDSAVMLHLARKAFYPAPPPFPLLHVDTTWKFREMIQFRDRMAAECGLDLIVHVNEEGASRGVSPFTHGSALYTDVMKTEGLKQALDQLQVRRRLRWRPPGRGKIPGQGADLFLPNRQPPLGPEEPAPGALEPVQYPGQAWREHPRLPPLQLDRAGRLAVHPLGEHSDRAALL